MAVTDAYIKIDIARLKQEYLKVLPHLSLDSVKTVTIESDEVKKVMEEQEKRMKSVEEENKTIMAWLNEAKPYLESLKDPEVKALIEKKLGK